jgi:hypothetical protein
MVARLAEPTVQKLIADCHATDLARIPKAMIKQPGRRDDYGFYRRHRRVGGNSIEP